MLKLVEPSKKYEAGYIKAVREFAQEGSLEGADALEDFDNYIADLVAQSEGKNLKSNYVPASTFWLTDEEEYIGRVSIRHSLNEELQQAGGHIGYAIRPSKRKQGCGKAILKLALPEAKRLGLQRVLVTCDENQRRITKKN
jgi:predicted acetyltransferase